MEEQRGNKNNQKLLQTISSFFKGVSKAGVGKLSGWWATMSSKTFREELKQEQELEQELEQE